MSRPRRREAPFWRLVDRVAQLRTSPACYLELELERIFSGGVAPRARTRAPPGATQYPECSETGLVGTIHGGKPVRRLARALYTALTAVGRSTARARRGRRIIDCGIEAEHPALRPPGGGARRGGAAGGEPEIVADSTGVDLYGGTDRLRRPIVWSRSRRSS